MRSGLVPAGIALGLAALVGLASPAAAAAGPQLKPKAGAYAGTETGPSAGATLTFVVAKNQMVVRKLAGTAAVKRGCKGPYSSYTPPAGPMAITAAGHFAASTTTYPGPKVRITVTGRFTSTSRAAGHIIVRFKRLKGCDATSAFSARRTT